MPTTITRAANSAAAAGFAGRWTNPSNAYDTVSNNVYATVTQTAKNTTYGDDYGFADFTTGDIPDGANIDSVYIKGEWDYTVQITGATLGCQPRLNGANNGSEQTKTATGESAILAEMTGVTLTDLRSASTLIKARVRASRGNSTNASEFRLDHVYLEVTYSTTQQYNETPSGSLSFTGTIAKDVSRALSGDLSFSGALTTVKAVGKSLTGSLSFSGVLTTIKSLSKSLSGGLSFTSEQSRHTARSMGGDVTFSVTLTTDFQGGVTATPALTIVHIHTE